MSESTTTGAQHTAIDLFCGCGGLSLGLKWAGFSVLAGVEVDRLAARTYAMNHPEVLLKHCDITGLSPCQLRDDLGLRKGDLDLLAGCPPCQGFSSIRTRNGRHDVNDSRNALTSQIGRYAESFLPKYILMENVPGLQAREEFQALVEFLISQLEYKVEYSILNAQDYGVSQSRRRLIMIASRHGAITFPQPLKIRKTVRDAFASLPAKCKDPLQSYTPNLSATVRAIIENIPPNGGSRTELPDQLKLACHRTSSGFKDVYGRLSWDRPSNTITGGCINPSKGRFLHPDENRPITLREAALLQSFPASYVFPLDQGRYPVARLIGNALPPVFIEAQAKTISEALKQ